MHISKLSPVFLNDFEIFLLFFRILKIKSIELKHFIIMANVLLITIDKLFVNSIYNPLQNILEKSKKSSKVRQDQKL